MSDELKKETACCEEHDHEKHDHEEDCCCGHHHGHGHHHEHGHHEEHEHHHEHGEECGCGHHHHHHEHGEHCGCGHDHDHEGHEHHHHEHSNIEVTSHEDATIATVKMTLGTDKEAAKVQLKSFMTAVGAEAEAAGGMVGHIKFFFKESAGQMYSMTDPEDEIQIKDAALPEYSAEGVCIVVGISPDALEDIVKLHYPGAV